MTPVDLDRRIELLIRAVFVAGCKYASPWQRVTGEGCNRALEEFSRFRKSFLHRCDDRFGTHDSTCEAKPILACADDFPAAGEMKAGLVEIAVLRVTKDAFGPQPEFHQG